MIEFSHEDRRDLLRWALSGVLVLTLHAGIAAAMVQWHDTTDAAEPTTALVIDLAPFPVAPARVPMDIAPRYAGTASGMMNFGFGVAGLISPALFGYLVDRTGSWVVPFIASVVLLLLGAVLATRLRPDIPFTEE